MARVTLVCLHAKADIFAEGDVVGSTCLDLADAVFNHGVETFLDPPSGPA